MKRFHFIVHGRVQGVGFRYFTQKCGKELKLTGWVKNLADGTVEAEAQGVSDDILVFYERLGQGPALSKVRRIDKMEVPIVDGESQFELTY